MKTPMSRVLVLLSFLLAAAFTYAKLEGPTVGIDLGTTYSCVATYKGGRVEVISNEQGNRITPSVVAWTSDGERLIGDAAKNQASSNPFDTVYDVKRFIGRKYNDPTVQTDKKLLPFEIVNNGGNPSVKVSKGEFTPEEISAMVLTKMKEVAQNFVGEKVVNAVVTVPAYFNDAQRQATIDAGRIAGLNIIRTVNEPTAAAMAYGLNKKSDDTKILVFDLGGGTFDVSILTLDDGVFQVLSTNGDTHLGGEDFDHRIVDWIIKRVQLKHKLNLKGNPAAIARIKREAERAKRALSSDLSTKIEVEGIINGEDFTDTLSRAKFEELNKDLFEKCLTPVKNALSDAKIEKSDIAEIVLVGGSTRIPYVQTMLSKFFDGRTLNKEVNPDEAVAYGAALQAAIVSGQAQDQLADWLLLDVTPLTIGLELSGGEYMRFIERNSPVPVKKIRYVTTEEDFQTSIPIRVFQGERANTKDNMLLGEFELEGLLPVKRGVPEVEVTFFMDANSILHVSAVDKATNKGGQVTIASDKNRLSEEQIKRMMIDAEKNAEADRQFQKSMNAKHSIEQYVYSIQGVLNSKAELRSADKARLTKVVNDLHNVLEGDLLSEEEYKAKESEAQAICTPIITKLYENGKKDGKDEL